MVDFTREEAAPEGDVADQPPASTDIRNPLPLKLTPDNPEFFNGAAGHLVPRNFSDSFWAEWELAAKGTALGNLDRMAAKSKAEEADPALVGPKDLNLMFAGQTDKPFVEPTSLSVAKEIVKQTQERRELQNTIDQGPHGFFYGAGRFTAQILPHALDPLELATGMMAGAALGGIGALAGEGSILSSAAAQNVFVRSAAEGLMGNTLLEPLNYVANQQELQDYGVKDSATNIVVGALGSAAAIYGIHSAIGYLRGLGGRAAEMAEKAAVGQLAMDRKITIDPILNDAVRERSGEIRYEGQGEKYIPTYQYEPLRPGESVSDREFYHPSPRQGYPLGQGPLTAIEDNFGRGLYMTDNPHVANGYAGSKFNDTDGLIYKTKTGDLNLLHLDRSLPSEVKDLIRPIIEESKLKGAKDTLELGTGKEVFEEIKKAVQLGILPENTFDSLNAKLMGAGFDGLVHTGGTFLGHEGAPHHVLMVFNPEGKEIPVSKVREVATIEPNRDILPRTSVSEAQKIAQERLKPENDLLYDPRDAEEYRSALEDGGHDPELQDIQAQHEQTIQELTNLREQGLLSEDLANELDQVQEMGDKQQIAQERAIKGATSCLGRSI